VRGHGIYAGFSAVARDRVLPTPDRLPELPSLFDPVVALREGGDALAHAVELAPSRGAGTLVWVSAYARAEAAVVLEPEMPLAPARLAFHAAASALVGTAVVNLGECGRVRLLAPANTAEDAVPDWLVVGMELRLAFPTGYEAGQAPNVTSLAEEGFEHAGPAEITVAWARHLMAGLDEWGARGPQRVAERYLARLLDEADRPGLRRGIDPDTGALVLENPDGARERLALPVAA